MGTEPCFRSDSNPVLGQIMVYSVNKIHFLVVTVELILLLFLNILFFNFVSISSKSIRLTGFRRSYINRTVVVLTNHNQSYIDILLNGRCLKCSRSFFAAV